MSQMAKLLILHFWVFFSNAQQQRSLTLRHLLKKCLTFGYNALKNVKFVCNGVNYNHLSFFQS